LLRGDATNGKRCRECRREYDRQRYANPEFCKQKSEQRRQRRQDPLVREMLNAKTKQWRADPDVRERNLKHKRESRAIPEVRERDLKYKRERRKNPEVREREREYTRKRRSTPKGKLDHSVGSAINQSLRRKGVRKSHSRSKFLTWGISELKAHLEPLFEYGMTWDNYGKEWQIDHIIPLSAVNYDSHFDPLFKMVWSLNNLAPLWKVDNQDKLASLTWELPSTYQNPKLRALYEDRDYVMTIF